jgi:Domain of unknown function (DUF3859)
MRALLIGLTSLALCQAAAAQGDVSAQVAWYGVYTVGKSQEIDDPASPTGKRYVATPVPPTANSGRIPGTQGVHFGLSFVLAGPAGAEFTVKEVYRFPPGGIPDKVNGGTRSTYESVQQATVGKPVLMGWNFETAPPEERVIGDWTFEVWQGGRKLLGQTFTVYSP